MKALIALLIMSVCVTNTSQANPTCQQVIAAADKAIAGQKRALEVCDLRAQTAEERGSQLETQVESQQKKLDSWDHNPLIMGLLGVIAGAAVTGYLLKK